MKLINHDVISTLNSEHFLALLRVRLINEYSDKEFVELFAQLLIISGAL